MTSTAKQAATLAAILAIHGLVQSDSVRAIAFDNCKYVVVMTSHPHPHPHPYTFAAYRHGEVWRDFTGDKFMGEMFERIKDLEALAPPTNDVIREKFLAAGFKVQEGQTDLKPYVFAAARSLFDAVKTS